MFLLPLLRTVKRQLKHELERVPAIRLQRRRREYDHWKRQGSKGPAPYLHKQGLPLAYARRFGLGTFVETGTYAGDTVAHVLRDFRRVYSIELDDRLYRAAARRFRDQSHVRILHGDSATLLPRLLAELDEPALFWLDAHYSGGITARGNADTPIMTELRTILEADRRAHVILIDDARCFGDDPAYPRIEDVAALVRECRVHWAVEVSEDVIRIYEPALTNGAAGA